MHRFVNYLRRAVQAGAQLARLWLDQAPDTSGKMSRFEAAARAAAATAPKPAAKPAAKTGAAAMRVVPKAGAAPVLKTLDDKKKFVKVHEHKIDDKAQEAQDEPNKTKRKELETALKKLQTDETYSKVKEEIKAAEAQAVKDAERAALNSKASPDAKAKPAPDAKAKPAPDAKGGAAAEEVSEAVMAEIDAALDGSGKEAAAAKAAAVSRLESLASATPFVLRRLDKLVALFADSKLGAPAVKAAC